MLRIQLYVLRQFEDNKNYGDSTTIGQHDRIKKFYGRPQLDTILEGVIREKRGQLLITTCVDYAIQDKIESFVKDYSGNDITVQHSAFQPQEPWSLWSPKLSEIKHEGVA